MMEQLALPLAIIVGISCYLIIALLLPKNVMQGRSQHLRSAMQRLEEQQKRLQEARPSEKMVKVRSGLEQNILVKAFLTLPGSSGMVSYVERAGLVGQLDKLILCAGIFWLLFAVVLRNMGPLGILLGAIAAFMVIFLYVRTRIKRRRKLFLSMLPDAIDIITRSVKAGYPINAAIGMVADSLPTQVGAEYLRVMNEASYGYSLGEAVTRFAERMNEPDVNFFAVVVNLQQETGGNLTETLGNLSKVIRARQQLRQKVRALSAEGKATVYILLAVGALMAGAMLFMNPNHFDLMFTTSTGHKGMMVAGVLSSLGFFFIHKITNFKM